MLNPLKEELWSGQLYQTNNCNNRHATQGNKAIVHSICCKHIQNIKATNSHGHPKGNTLKKGHRPNPDRGPGQSVSRQDYFIQHQQAWRCNVAIVIMEIEHNQPATGQRILC